MGMKKKPVAPLMNLQRARRLCRRPKVSFSGATGMSTLPIFVGLDYHQSTVQVCVMDASGRVLLNKACANDWRAIVQLVGAVGTPRRVAIEACTGSLDLAQE